MSSTARKGLDKNALYAAFASGRSQSELAREMGIALSTINYHFKQWEKAGRPDPREDAQAPVKTANEPATTGMVTDPPKALDRPASEEELRRLADVLSGKTTVDPVNPGTLPPPKQPAMAIQTKLLQPTWDIQVGEVYEGAINTVVGDEFILVDLVELADEQGRCPRGKVDGHEVGYPAKEWRQIFRTDGLVNVKVLSVHRDPHRNNKLRIALSIKQAPLHPLMSNWQPAPPPPTPAPQQPDPAPLTPPAPVQTTPAPVIDQPAPTPASSPAASLCDTCIHRFGPFCPFKGNYVDDLALGAEYKPDNLQHIEVVYGPRPVIKCAAYTALDSIKVGQRATA